MPLSIRDEETIRLVTELAQQRWLSLKDAIRLAVQTEMGRAARALPLRQRLEALWAAHPMPPATGAAADKPFYEDISSEI